MTDNEQQQVDAAYQTLESYDPETQSVLSLVSAIGVITADCRTTYGPNTLPGRLVRAVSDLRSSMKYVGECRYIRGQGVSVATVDSEGWMLLGGMADQLSRLGIRDVADVLRASERLSGVQRV